VNKDLDAQIICAEIQKRNAGSQSLTQLVIEVIDETASTNFDLMQRAREITHPILLVAKHQTAGRGRAGRMWLSTIDGVLTFSLAWRFDSSAQELMGLPLVVGVALAETLLEIGVPVKVKWPNDILKEGKKLAGILVESVPSGLKGTCAVIGIGLNLQISDELELQIGQAVADAPWLAQMDRNLLLALLIHALSVALETFQQRGFAVFVERWNQLHAFAHHQVAIIEQGRIQQSGLALGVDTYGRLLLQTEREILAIHSGDVSLRALS
jgi:BirA family biotin operon repressor/biotin-[acetyl-CoA-carboxylase] ligase